jgi:hypothetical protein
MLSTTFGARLTILSMLASRDSSNEVSPPSLFKKQKSEAQGRAGYAVLNQTLVIQPCLS